jgi:hypothetical protein
MTSVLFQLSDGSTLCGGPEDSDDLDEDHPIFSTGFVRGLMENHHDATRSFPSHYQSLSQEMTLLASVIISFITAYLMSL